jgi:hypothetical protein
VASAACDACEGRRTSFAMAKSSNAADTTGMYDERTSVLHKGTMEEKTARSLPGETVLGVLLLVISDALLAVDVGVTGVVRAVDRSLPRPADLELASASPIAEVTTPAARRISSACNLCDSSHTPAQVEHPQPQARVAPVQPRRALLPCNPRRRFIRPIFCRALQNPWSTFIRTHSRLRWLRHIR